jgi:hypothetical protein
MSSVIVNPAQIQLVKQLVEAYGYDHTMSALANMSGYISTPPTIEQFIFDDDYLGQMLGWDEGEGRNKIYTKWRSALNEIFPNPFHSPYMEIILSGAIGTGKSTVAIAGAMYDICKLTHLRNPQAKFQLLESTIIAYAVINATLTLAKDVLFDQLIEWIEASPYFRSLVNKSSGRTRFPKGIDIVAGSRFDQVMGRAIVGAILDEMNFQTRVANQAYDNYNSVRQRITSRFLGKGGSWPAHLWLVSSKSDETGWLQSHIDAMADVPFVRTFEYPIWDILVDKEIYSGKTFKVFIGDKTRDPFIIERPDQVVGIDDALLIDVPIEYEHDFTKDIFRALQDLAGSGTWSSRNFISSKELMQECQIRENPVTQNVITLDFHDKSQKLVDYIIYHQLDMDSRARFIHIDIGLKHDKTGIASTRFDGYVTLTRFDPTTGKMVKVREPIYYTDWVMAIEAKPGHEVALYKIQNLITDLRSRGYPIAKVSVDGYQSANLRQNLMLLGFEAEEISVDKKKDPYYNFKNSILESRYNGVKHPIFNDELIGLLDNPKKIDHPHKGSKDITDAVAGSVWSAYMSQDQYANVMAPGEYIAAFEQYIQEEESFYDKILNSATSVHEVYR